MIYLRGEITAGQCGIGRIKDFRTLDSFRQTMRDRPERWKTPEDCAVYYQYYPLDKNLFNRVKGNIHHGGIDIFGTGMINTDECKEVFETINQWFKVEYMSPIRLNKNSLKKFFYIMWDTTNTDVSNNPKEWPFNEQKT